MRCARGPVPSAPSRPGGPYGFLGSSGPTGHTCTGLRACESMSLHPGSGFMVKEETGADRCSRASALIAHRSANGHFDSLPYSVLDWVACRHPVRASADQQLFACQLFTQVATFFPPRDHSVTCSLFVRMAASLAAAGAIADSAFIQWMKGADPIEQQPEFWKAIEKVCLASSALLLRMFSASRP